MIRIAIVEDEEAYVQQLTSYLHEYQKTANEEIAVTVYRDGDEITSKYKSQYDIILMDIQMKFVDGMTALGQVRISLPLSFFRKAVYFVALFLLPYFYGAEMTFAAESISDIVAPIVSFIVVKRSLNHILQWRLAMREN